ncbi:MAG: DNA-3-methyladenine glycosylase I [Acidimicrobiia bacterium]
MFNVDTGEDGLPRCWWGCSPPEYARYHDTEWGYPVTDDRVLFEKLCLEGFQSGLSWLTILRKRDNFRAAFHNFDIAQVAAMDGGDVERLLQDPGIVRHRGKIESTINNARRCLELIEEQGSFAAFVWRYESETSDVRDTKTPESEALARDLKKRGFTFVGPTTAYAFMQAMGLVNDHLEGCHVRELVAAAREALARP